MTRSRWVGPILASSLLLSAASVSPVLAEDVTDPDGTLIIENGAEWTNSPLLHLDVTATDDVGVVTVRVRRQGFDWVDYAYAPNITFSLGDPATLQDGPYSIDVAWYDAVGHGDGAIGTINYDATPPNLASFQETTPTIGPPDSITFVFGLGDSIGAGWKVRFSSDGGTTWGTAQTLPDPQFAWDPFDVDKGGSSLLGPRTVKAKVRDPAGNWSNVRSTTINALSSVQIDVSAHPTTGQPITLTPQWAHPVTFPAGTYCRWDFSWGNDASLYLSDHDETFGNVSVGGNATAGYCGKWTFTLPWTPVRKYDIQFIAIDDDTLANAGFGNEPSAPNLNVTVGSTSRDITSSNLPMLYVLPEKWELTVGVPAIYHAHGVGGATVKSTDQWHVSIPERLYLYPGSATFSYTPIEPGHVTVCIERTSAHGPLIGACYDPPVKRAPSSGPGTTALPAATGQPVATGLESAASDASPGIGTEAPAASFPAEEPTLTAIGAGTPGPGATAPPTVDSAPTSGTAGSALLTGIVLFGLVVGGGVLAWRRGWRPPIRRSTRA